MGRKSKEYDDRELTQGRAFQCIIYPDSTEYDAQLLLNRLDFYWDKAWYIYHDCDGYTEEEVQEWKIKNKSEDCPFAVGDLKKPHFHCIGYRDSPLVLGHAAEIFGLKSNYVQKCKSLKAAVRYLLHKDQPNKFQYDVDKIHMVNCDKRELAKFLRMDVDAMDKGKKLFEFIMTHDRITLSQLVRFSFENDCYDELRRGQHLFTALLVERNGK